MTNIELQIGQKLTVTFIKAGEQKHLLRMTPEELEIQMGLDNVRRLKGEVLDVKGEQVIVKTWEGVKSFRKDRVLELELA
jgi:hypothetical protein